MRQAEVEMAERQWEAADSSFLRVRALGDTLPGALQGQITALVAAGRGPEALRVAMELRRRWPGDSLARGVRGELESSAGR